MVGVPDELQTAANNFTADFDIVNDRGQTRIEPMWEMSHESGITGLWYPNEPLMAAVDPPLAHHDDLYEGLADTVAPVPPVMPWKAAIVGDMWQVEIPVPGGSMWSVDLEDEELLTNAEQVGPEVLWPVVYTCARIGVPEDALVTFDYDPPRTTAPLTSLSIEMRDLYAELQLTPAGIPEPIIERGDA